MLGECGLDGTGAKGEADAKNRVYHIVYAKPFCTDGTGKENTVEKAQHPAGQAGAGKKDGTGEEGSFFGGQFGKGNHGVSKDKKLLQYMGDGGR